VLGPELFVADAIADRAEHRDALARRLAHRRQQVRRRRLAVRARDADEFEFARRMPLHFRRRAAPARRARPPPRPRACEIAGRARSEITPTAPCSMT
jgi:hypothetical protein